MTLGLVSAYTGTAGKYVTVRRACGPDDKPACDGNGNPADFEE